MLLKLEILRIKLWLFLAKGYVNFTENFLNNLNDKNRYQAEILKGKMIVYRIKQVIKDYEGWLNQYE